MTKKKTVTEKFANDQAKGAQQDLVEQLFDDHYKHRGRIYQVNFFRGISFGFGSVLGATVLVAILLWLLSFFNEMPFIGDVVKSTQQSIEQRSR